MATWLTRSFLAKCDVDATPCAAPDARPQHAPDRAFWLKNILAGAMLCGLLLSPKLWLSARSYPLSPVWDDLPAMAYPLDHVCYYGLLALLLAILVMPRSTLLIVAFVVLAGAYSLWDQTRWQPWFYQYLAMFVALAFFPWRDRHDRRAAPSLNACRIIVAFTYFWSGVQKCNESYVQEVHPWIIEPLQAALPAQVGPWLAVGSWGVSFIELSIGVGLIVWPLRNVTVCLAVFMHLVLLYALGPLGHNWNSVVWPWNVAMALMVMVLFWRSRDVCFTALLWPRGWNCQAAALVFFGVMPAFSFWGWWDDYLSAALYSGNVPTATIYVSHSILEKLPEAVRKEAGWSFEENVPPNSISLTDWAFQELNVPPYPAPRVFCNIARQLAKLGKEQGEVGVIIEERPPWHSLERAKTVYVPGVD